ncbi:Hypothetical protein LUCI_0796 [Lucifera butyrica]|uniref:Uncharacterized protein n=1 Tax=Lucifera butyrica TaxID=1351585 RepID=A0A498QZG5_9FIRM|nr:hypothetical protein [Lucifera butyrica]VBB05586.1 Hypothetical protein LUCI_0796 [Lucifera butyrica]
MSISRFKTALQIKFGLPPGHPTNEELNKIFTDINRIPLSSRTEAAWGQIVEKHVAGFRTYKYAGLDMSDLNVMYSQIINLLGK